MTAAPGFAEYSHMESTFGDLAVCTIHEFCTARDQATDLPVKAKAVACEAGHLPDDVAYREKARYHLNLFVW
jgi:hypothetical protein